MSATQQSTRLSYQWSPQPAAAALVCGWIEKAVEPSAWLQKFRQRLYEQTGTRLLDWVDHLVVDDGEQSRLRNAGFVREHDTPAWMHPGGLFPRVLLRSDAAVDVSLAIKVERLEDFLQAQQLERRAELFGSEGVRLRVAMIDPGEKGRCFGAVERHGDRGFAPQDRAWELGALEAFKRRFRARDRSLAQPAGFKQALLLFWGVAESLGRDWACDLFFAAERDYWMGRNRAAQVQYARQQQLGLGWANHDHHTYRCSRELFAPLIRFLEQLGFSCRERFYAGREAGWGAQVLEHPQCGIVVFADVDLSEDEVIADFAHEPLPPRHQLGTVGLWCKLHGDSFFSAGMHHLECQFDFDAARRQLAEHGVETMAPFTDFPYLKQAFTKGEIWKPDQARLEALVAAGQLTSQQAEKFAAEGAIGSHLEILERNEGYKGFNQTGISEIIRRTDPRE